MFLSAIQERNSFALSVWWKVKSKLDGKDQDAGKRMLVTEQVNFIFFFFFFGQVQLGTGT